MENNGRSRQVEELIASGILLINDGYRAKNSELATHGVPFARAGNINNGFHFEHADCFPSENLDRVGFKTSRPGDVVFTSKGTVGRFGFVGPEIEQFVYAPQLCFWRSLDHKEISPRWLFYWMQGPEFFAQYKSVAGQTDMAEYVSLRDQRKMYITVPPLPEQKAIAHILGTLDDKIELNHRMNETLEAMARAIFKSWFVAFDPVRAKLDGKKPVGMDEETAALFPDGFQHTELGLVPKGWAVESIRDRAASIQYGLTKSASSEPVGPRFLRITDIRGGTLDWEAVPYCDVADSDFEKYKIRDGDIFVARTGASTGENIYVTAPPRAVFASYLVRFQFRSQGVARVVGQHMRTPDYFGYVEGSIGGSAQPNASAQTLAGAPMVFPMEELCDAYSRVVHPFDVKRAANSEEATTLASLRDTLLPKLLSGEIRVSEAEKAVEEVA